MDPRLGMLIKARRVVFAILAVLSTVGALALVYAAFGSGDSRLTPTAALIGIFVLLVFPAATIWAWAWDRSVRKKSGTRNRVQIQSEAIENSIEHGGGRQRRGARHEARAERAETKI